MLIRTITAFIHSSKNEKIFKGPVFLSQHEKVRQYSTIAIFYVLNPKKWYNAYAHSYPKGLSLYFSTRFEKPKAKTKTRRAMTL